MCGKLLRDNLLLEQRPHDDGACAAFDTTPQRAHVVRQRRRADHKRR